MRAYEFYFFLVSFRISPFPMNSGSPPRPPGLENLQTQLLREIQTVLACRSFRLVFISLASTFSFNLEASLARI